MGGSSYRGFELSGLNCTYMYAIKQLELKVKIMSLVLSVGNTHAHTFPNPARRPGRSTSVAELTTVGCE